MFKKFLIFCMLFFVFASTATASVLGTIGATLISSVVAAPLISAVVGGLIPILILIIHRVIPNKKIQLVIGTPCRFAGNFVSNFFSHYKWTKAIWNTVIEPFFIDLIDNTFGCAIREFVVGLRMDNKK